MSCSTIDVASLLTTPFVESGVPQGIAAIGLGYAVWRGNTGRAAGYSIAIILPTAVKGVLKMGSALEDVPASELHYGGEEYAYDVADKNYHLNDNPAAEINEAIKGTTAAGEAVGEIENFTIKSVNGDIRKFSEYALTNPSKKGLFVDSWGYKAEDAESLLSTYERQASQAVKKWKMYFEWFHEYRGTKPKNRNNFKYTK